MKALSQLIKKNIEGGSGRHRGKQLSGRCTGALMGLVKGEIVSTALAEVVVNKNPIDLRLLELALILAT